MKRSEIRVLADYTELGHALADAVMVIAEDSIAKRGLFRLVLNGGGTPEGLFRILGSKRFAHSQVWAKTQFFWGDERCVPPDADGSSYKQARLSFLKHVNVYKQNVLRIEGELGPEAAAEHYAHLLAGLADPATGLDWPRFDLVLLGVGGDGHTASLFPRQPVPVDARAAIPVRAHYEDRPAERVSLTPAVFNSSRNIFIMASGASKAAIVDEVFRGVHQPEKWPIQYIRQDLAVWWLDQDAAKKLQRRI